MEVTLQQAGLILQKADNIVLTVHVNPDGDCLGSMLALYEYLTGAGKQVQMLLDDDVPSLYRFLSGHELISKPTEANPAVDLLVVLDASDFERIGRVGQINAPILNIDHHISNTRFADHLYLDSHAAATGEIIYSILEELGASITATMANALYAAIATDCGYFRYANTTADTLQIASRLVSLGARPQEISEAMETRNLSSLVVLKKVLDTLELQHEGKIATITVTQRMLSSANDTTEGLINYPRTIEGVEVAIMFKEAEQDTVRVSFRSKQVDVSKLALSFGGGGHARAAGCTLQGPLDIVKEKVLAAAAALVR